MHVGIAADHGGFALKAQLVAALKAAGHEVTDFGAHELVMGDDYPDYVIPLAKAVAKGKVNRGLAICSSGVGAGIASNKIPGVRAALITDPFSAQKGVEDDDLNMICLGSLVVGDALTRELVNLFIPMLPGGGEKKWDWKKKRQPTSMSKLLMIPHLIKR